MNLAALTTIEGRSILLAHSAQDERLAAETLLRVAQQAPPDLHPVVLKHMGDELSHAQLLQRRMADFPPADWVLSRASSCLEAMKPKTFAEYYAAILVAEERAAKNYPQIAAALREAGDLETAEIFDVMARDEVKHIAICHFVLKTLGDPQTRAILWRYRSIATDDVELYDRSKHFDMVRAWGEPIDANALGCGLVIPDVCCGFVDRIGQTTTGYFYGLRSNPSVPLVRRGRAILRLAERILAAAREAGITRGVTSTSNSVVFRFWADRMGFKRSSETLLEGVL